MLKFNNEHEAFEYWQEEVWGCEEIGRCFDDQVDMFNDWLHDNAIVYHSSPNMNLQD